MECTFLAAMRSSRLLLTRGRGQYLTIGGPGDTGGRAAASVVRDKFSSAPSLPSLVPRPAHLAHFPGDTRHRDTFLEAALAARQRSGPGNICTLVNAECCLRRNAVSAVAVDPGMFDYDTDSDKVSDVLEDDLERGSATLAAFVVTLITVTFFGTLVSMISVTMSLSGDYQVGNIWNTTQSCILTTRAE